MADEDMKGDGRPTGFNLNTQKLHCLILLDDKIGDALSSKAGVAFFRAFVVEDRASGKVMANMRFRYKDHDSWYRVTPNEAEQRLSLKEKIEYLSGKVGLVIRVGLAAFVSATPPETTVVHLYPPNPDDGQATLDWLIAQDLVEITEVAGPDGRVRKVSRGSNAVT